MSNLSGADIIIHSLEKLGVQYVSGIPGGANLPLYDALNKSSIKHVLARHEQGAGFIAHGIARSTDKVGVCLASSGPGATNLITAIADAKMDSVPIVAITGQVPLSMVGTDAFQEIDTYGLTIPITKHNYFVRDADELTRIIPEAFAIAKSGRPGPVAIDVPKDIQLQKVKNNSTNGKKPLFGINGRETKEKPDNYTNQIAQILEMIHRAKKPLLYIGGGVIHSHSSDLIREIARKNSIPVTSTLMGLGGFPYNDSLYLGMIGMHGLPFTNYILDEVDLLLAFGVRFDDRATGKVQEFCKNAAIVHVDIDGSEINKIKTSDVFINGDLHCTLKEMALLLESDTRSEWMCRVNHLKKEHPWVLPPAWDLFHPINIIRKIAELAGEDTIITTDVGQHQMWVAQAYPLMKPKTFITSGGLGTMGFGLPTSIGVALANPDKRVICFTGDGSIMMNIQELATLNEMNLNITIVVLNNYGLGLVRQQQEFFYKQNYFASEFITKFNFADIGRAFGIKSFQLQQVSEPIKTLHSSLQDDGPCMIDISILSNENVFPMVPPGFANRDMIGGKK
ncbi:MAG: biosynthetic-type acetolactate synthase large subunit [Leptospiraceae bacterium]|nr:biosynthetic-type acetolactate synthase large subunit [Leptospiraceae bacterium]MCP5495068.1 biosynthetic-type acetolactate synthase large subunit [Leptospiraceae bacterium]